MEGEKNESDGLIGERTLGFGRNLLTGKVPGIYKDDLAKNPSTGGEGF